MKRPTLIMIAALGSTACLPPAGDAGEVDPTESGTMAGDGTDATADSSETGGEPPAGADVEWTFEVNTDPNAYVVRMVRSPDGVVAVRHGQPLVTSPEVFEVSSGMEILWSQTLDDAGVGDLAAMGGGQYLLAGSTRMGDDDVPTAWRLSCCGGSEYQTFPLGGTDPLTVSVIEPRADGIFMAVYTSGPTGPVAAFLQTELDFSQDLGSQLGTYDGRLYDGAHTRPWPWVRATRSTSPCPSTSPTARTP